MKKQPVGNWEKERLSSLLSFPNAWHNLSKIRLPAIEINTQSDYEKDTQNHAP